MINPKLYQSSGTYDFFMKLLGYEASIDRFLHGLEFQNARCDRILDAGCGTGLLGLHFLNRFPESALVATDLEPNFLQATLSNADKRGLDRTRISVGVADISDPRQVKPLDRETMMLEDASFGLICVGAVVGYAADTEASVRQLLNLLAPGGYLINLEMNESPSGRFVSHRYQYNNIKLSRMLEVMHEEGCEATATRLPFRTLPAKLTRTAVIARKSIG